MKAKTSPLQLIDFTVFNCSFESIQTDDPKVINLPGLPVDIDFDVYEPKGEVSNLRIIEMRLSVNKTRKKPGYSITLTSSGVFAIQNIESMHPHEVGNLLGISTINMMISNIRGYLKNISSYAPYGAYLLPSIDMGHLIKEKGKQAAKLEGASN